MSYRRNDFTKIEVLNVHRLLVRAAAGHPRARPPLRVAELPLLLREHLRLGDQPHAAVEGCHRHHQGEDCLGE